MLGTTALPLAAMVAVVVLLHAAHRAAGAAAGDGSGERSCGSMKLRYPFGFSSGCKIRLGCDDHVPCLGDARELGLLVRNVTPRGIILGLKPDCSRSFNASVAALFSDSYAPVSGNGLVVSSCSPSSAHIDVCSSEPGRSTDRSSAHCSANESIRCLPPRPPSTSAAHQFLNKSKMLASECTGLVSSVRYADGPVPAEELSALGLSWWVLGQCRCSTSANCTQFVAPTTGQAAFRCECTEGFEGDGFIDGAGCQRAGQ
jgi:hypothetical protein